MSNYRYIVFICDRIKKHTKDNIYNDTFEMTDDEYYDEVFNALTKKSEKVFVYNNLKSFLNNIAKHKNDLVVSIWSGKDSKSRKAFVSAICECYDIKYVGADAYVQTLAQDKVLSKEFCSLFGIKSAEYVWVNSLKDLEVINRLKMPVVVKPNYEGGSIGISDKNLIFEYSEAKKLSKKLFKKYKSVLIEEYIEGAEISICIIGNGNEILHKGISQINISGETYFKNKIWGYESKKLNETLETIHAEDNIIDQQTWENIYRMFSSLGKVDYMRIDGRLNSNGFYLIELAPDAYIGKEGSLHGIFIHKELSYEDMINSLIEAAINFYQYQSANKQ